MRDNRGAAASEYALIVALMGAGLYIATTFITAAVSSQMDIRTVGPGGRVYVCVENCQFEYKDYCIAAPRRDQTPVIRWEPALPAGAACINGVPTS